MHDDHRFEPVYLALIALNWQALERIDALLPDVCEPWSTPLLEGRLQWLRLELLQLRTSVVRCAQARRLSDEQQQQVQLLVQTLLEWLDFDATTTVEVVHLRLGAAQNWLLDEVDRSREAASCAPDCERGRRVDFSALRDA